MSDCLFCKIIDGSIAAKRVYEDDYVIAFEDLNPQAPLHVLIIPRKHISSINDIQSEDTEVIGRLYLAAKKIARQEEVADDGYRVVVNCGKAAGQTVFHLHMHLLAGRSLSWPPG